MRDLIKTIALIKRRPDLSREQFARHYEQVHVPLALRYFRGFEGYIRNHVVEVLVGEEPTFDCISAFWYPDRQALREAVEFLASDAAGPVRDDELSFMDKSRNVFFVAEEEVIMGDRARFRADAPAKAIALVARRDDIGRGEFFEGYEREELSRLLEGSAAVRCVQNRVESEAARASGRAVDCITEIWFGDSEDRRKAMGSFRPELGSATLVAVSESETLCGE